ncbi:MAG: YegP family protein [Acholeplasmatales bacterium]|nr:YegP family protein [Acholeplasmatales bacterium]
MFGRKKKDTKAQELREQELKKAEKEREARQHDKLVERYNKAREYDRRVALGEDPAVVEAEVYNKANKKAEEPVEEEPVEEEPVEEELAEEEPSEEESAEEELAEEEPTEEELVEEESVKEEPSEEESVEEEPTEEELAEEEPSEEESVEEEPSEEELVEEEPTEEELVEEEPVEEESAEEKAPLKKAPAKKAAAKKAPVKKATTKKAVKEEGESSNEKVLVEADPNDKTNGKYEIFQETGGYKYRIVASNGQILATSEVYTKASGARDGIKTLKNNLDSLLFHVETDKHRKSQFMATTAQNKILVTSANYATKKSAESAIDSFKNFALATKIVLLNNEDESKPEIVDRKQFLKAAGKGKFVVLFNQEGLTYQFALKASNGQIIVTSKFYKSDVSCKAAISKFKKDVKEGTFYTVRDKNGNYEFRLYNANNKLVQSGTAFTTKTKCLANIESVIRFIDSDID